MQVAGKEEKEEKIGEEKEKERGKRRKLVVRVAEAGGSAAED